MDFGRATDVRQSWGKVQDISDYSGLSVRTVRDLLKIGLKYSRLPSGTILVRFIDVDAFLESFSVVRENGLDDIVNKIVREVGL